MTPLTALRATAARLLAPTPMPRCHCGLAVGGPNQVRGKVGDIIIGCATCTPERRLDG
jgi:hypothetical protein